MIKIVRLRATRLPGKFTVPFVVLLVLALFGVAFVVDYFGMTEITDAVAQLVGIEMLGPVDSNKDLRYPWIVLRVFLDQDFLFGRPGTNRVADPRAAIQRFSHYFPVWTPLAAAPAVECCPIAPFQQTQRAFWQNPSRADPRQPA